MTATTVTYCSKCHCNEHTTCTCAVECDNPSHSRSGYTYRRIQHGWEHLPTRPDQRRIASLTRLAQTQAEIDELDKQRTALVDSLDQIINELRGDGVSWTQINEACDVTNMQMSWQRRMRRRKEGDQS